MDAIQKASKLAAEELDDLKSIVKENKSALPTGSTATILQSENESLKKLVRHYEVEAAKNLRRMLEVTTNGQWADLYRYDPSTFNAVLEQMNKAKRNGKQ